MNKIDKKWQLKIICLLLAIVLWFVIINEQNPLSEGSYTVPITVENLDSQYITSNVPKTVYVRLSGPRNTIINESSMGSFRLVAGNLHLHRY